jgi:capsular polysaccharide biosynthesis protein
VPARLDLRWPASWPERPIHPHPRHRRTTRPDEGPFVQHFPTLASIVHRYGGAYYHWLLESVPRLLQLRARLAADPTLPLLVDYDFGGSFTNTWTDQYLDLLGIDRRRVVRYDPARIYTADTLYVSGPVASGTPTASATAAIRAALLPRTGRVGPPVIVAVSRANAACRRIRNWPALVAALNAMRAAEVVDFVSDDWSVRDQIALFARADAVVGAHGAGLANMVFCDPGTPIAEIVPADHVGGACFEIEAKALSLPHRFHRGAASGLHDDFEVAIERFMAAFAAQLAERTPRRRAASAKKLA